MNVSVELIDPTSDPRIVSIGRVRVTDPVMSVPTAATLTLPFPTLNPSDTSLVFVTIDALGTITYTFAPTDPGGDTYLGQANGNAAADADTLVSAINPQGNATASRSGTNITITSLTTGSSSLVALSGFLNGTANGHD